MPDDEIEDSIEVMLVPEAALSRFIRPLEGSISNFHRPNTAEFSLAMNDFRTHTGINIDGEIGANVRAVADGVITEIRDDPFRGQTVVIEHGGGIISVYQNLQFLLPQNIVAGAAVAAGDTIGGVGETALIRMTEVPHLHFEMTLNGEPVDPLEYIDFGQTAASG
jgi:murein DD-endopeptidase MepM/ murein hydrolase activator NlpD